MQRRPLKVIALDDIESISAGWARDINPSGWACIDTGKRQGVWQNDAPRHDIDGGPRAWIDRVRVWFILHQPMQYYAVDELFDTLGRNLALPGLFTLDGATPSAHVGPLYPAVLATSIWRLVTDPLGAVFRSIA